MLTMELTTWDGRSYRLPVLLSWCLTYTGGVPCDSMTASCPYDKSMAEMLPDATRFTAFQDGEIMLRGVIDAYEISLVAVPAQREAGVIKSKRYGGQEPPPESDPPGKEPGKDEAWRDEALLELEKLRF